jgi:hypothetical protein
VVAPLNVAAPASEVAPPKPPKNCAWALGGNAHSRPASRTAVTGFANRMPFVFLIFMLFPFFVSSAERSFRSTVIFSVL